MLEIYITDGNDRFKLDNLYWFEENGVHDFGGEGHFGQQYEVEIFIDGKLVWKTGEDNYEPWQP